MSFKLTVDDAEATLTLPDLPFYRDTPISTHFWGNSRLTQFGLTRLVETFLNVYIASIHIRNRPGVFGNVEDNKFRLAGLWNCGFDAFFDEEAQTCRPCHASCTEGCIRGGTDNCKCYDIECQSCRNFTPASECLSCGLLTSLAIGTSNPCECKLGFSRDTENGGAHVNRCELDFSIEIPCIGAGLFCDMCNSDTGNWFGDCNSCKPGFFRQFNARSCLDHCPTGSIAIPLLNECPDVGLLPVSNVVFNLLGPIYKGLPFGTFHLEAGLDFGNAAPQNTIDRGLFFDGGSGFVKINGIILNTNFSVHFWVYFFEFNGDLLAVESETPTTNDEEQVLTYTCGESPSKAEEADVGCNYNGEETKSETEGNVQLESWIDFNMIAKWNEIDSTMDITFHIGEFTLEITKFGNPFHQKKDTGITFCKGCHAFVLNFSLFNQVIQLPQLEGLRLQPEFSFDFSLPTCPIRSFLFGGSCEPCLDICGSCSGSADNCILGCADKECSLCSGLGLLDCVDCGIHPLLDGVCECAEGFIRNDPESPCSIAGVACTVLDLVGRCTKCETGLGNWWDDCNSCEGPFFLQPFTRSCLDYCPSGSIGLFNICGEFSLGPVF